MKSQLANKKSFQRVIKRSIDLIFATILLVVLSPLMVLTALLIRQKLGSPVFFRQKRPGHFGKPFFLTKFRTMTDARDTRGELLPDENRLSNFGKLVRSSSVDELPQLLNVLHGDMSLVGPRPLLMQYLPLYTELEARRHSVKPGITGWAQVKGRNAISWKEKFSLDIWYVDNWSLWLDIKILFLTVSAVVGRKGVSRSGHVTTVPYDGTN